ncbi:MAG: hypothetical protein EZS28_031717 [Streblomastix strix]|uniref:Uncharacterized protein n=1 Tax=Streblomastix strix TaxID=222440 RepID=A0A5J4UPZ3_9EUKA|nr:MAG: hypothetical protein EZS28_031717 [Streblomastix strix]
MTSPRLTAAIRSIVEVDSPFEKESQPVAQIQTRRRSSIFEETIMPDPSVCRREIAYTFDVVENQVILNTEDEGCCGKFMHDGTRTLSDITQRHKHTRKQKLIINMQDWKDPVANTYLTMSEVDSKLMNYVITNTGQQIDGTKTFNANVNATGFVKTGKDDTSVPLAGGGERLLSSFGGIEDLTSTAFSRMKRLLDTAGLMDFPELYAYIRERDSQPPVETELPVPIGEQTLLEQVKIIADIFENTNDVFIPSEPNMPIKIDYGQQIVNNPFVFNEMQFILIVYGERVTLNCFVTIKQQFNGYIFNSYPQDAQPMDSVQIITVICNKFCNNINLFCYIDEKSPYIYAEDDREIAANTSIEISTTYYKQFEALKQINYDSNNDGKVYIMDVWNESEQGTHEAQSYVYYVVKKQSDQVDHHIEGTVLHNFLNNDIKLINKLGIYKADCTAYYIQGDPIVMFSFGAKLGDNIGNIYKIFSTIDSKILSLYAKFLAMHPEQKEFKGYCQQVQQLDKSQGFQVIISGKLDKKDREFASKYVEDMVPGKSRSGEFSKTTN